MKQSKYYLVFIFSLFTLAHYSQAESCAGGYTRADRKEILRLERPAGRVLTRMATIAEFVANGNLSVPQQSAYDAEFQALKLYLNQFGDITRNISARSNLFASTVIDSNYLNLSTQSVLGATVEESQHNARNSLDALNGAISQLSICLHNSWERVTVDGSPNDNQCAGGYNARDSHLVKRRAALASKKLIEMTYKAEYVANNITSRGQRVVFNADYQYFIEEIFLDGKKAAPRATLKTRRFLNKFINPVFLGVLGTGVYGDTISEGQQNARNALDAINASLFTIQQCIRR